MSSDEHKIKIKIERLDKSTTISYTNTGLRPVVPSVEDFEWWGETLPCEAKSVYLEYSYDWNLFSPILMNTVGWYVRTFFSSASKLNIDIDIVGSLDRAL